MRRALFTLDVESTSGSPTPLPSDPLREQRQRNSTNVKGTYQMVDFERQSVGLRHEWAQHQSEPHVHAIIMVNERALMGKLAKLSANG